MSEQDETMESGVPPRASAPPYSSLARPGRLRTVVQAGAAIVLSTSIALVLIYYNDAIAGLGDWGYVGIFVIQTMNSATIILPAPGHAYTFAAAATLNPALVGLIGGVGAGLGELTGYVLGANGYHILSGGRLYGRLRAFTERWGGVALFLFAALPVPFDIAGIWAGTVRYPLWRFLLYVTVGKMVKVTGIALVGFYSVPWLLRLMA